MQELVTVTAKNFFVSYTSGYGIEGSRLDVSYGVSGKTSHILTRDFPTEDEAKQYALDMGYLVPHRKTMQVVVGNGQKTC
jgi:hypothetical protein